MTLLSTESWMSYPLWTGDDSSAANNARALANNTLVALGFDTYMQQGPTIGWLFRPHPVYPERAALVFSAPGASISQYIVRKRVAVGRTGTLIGGFSLFVPSAFIKNPGTGIAAYPFLMIFASPVGAGLVNMENTDGLRPYEIFRVRYDLAIGRGTTAQSSKAIVPGKMSYIEYRITGSEVRVWLDDTLVYQEAISGLSIECISFGTVAWDGGNGGSSGSSMSLAAGRWAIADWYNLLEDSVEPNTRLGPSTRVIGVLPNQDDTAQFVRPSGYTSNAAVAKLPYSTSSSDYLKTDTVGNKDIYVGAEDAATAGASLVHAVNVKVIGQNAETAAHTITPLIVSGNVEGGSPQTLPASFKVMSSITTLDPATGQKWTPAAAAASKFGVKLTS